MRYVNFWKLWKPVEWVRIVVCKNWGKGSKVDEMVNSKKVSYTVTLNQLILITSWGDYIHCDRVNSPESLCEISMTTSYMLPWKPQKSGSEINYWYVAIRFQSLLLYDKEWHFTKTKTSWCRPSCIIDVYYLKVKEIKP